MIDTIVLIIIIFGPIVWLALRADKQTRQRHPELFQEPVVEPAPPAVRQPTEFEIRIRRNYFRDTRKRLRREQRRTQHTINQLVDQLSKMEKSK